MAKITLENVTSGFQSTVVQNANNDLLEAEFEKVLYRNDDTGDFSPLSQDIDMNSNQINNLTAGVSNSQGVNVGQMNTAIGSSSSQSIEDAQIVANISALKAVSVTSLITGQHAITQGYAIRGDDGGTDYFFDSASSATDNGGSVLAPDVGSGRWLHIITDQFNVRQFGAAGDDSTNDRTALFTADAEGNTYIPAGIFKVSSNLTFTNSVYFSTGAILKPDVGVKISFNKKINADLTQHFDTSASGSSVVGGTGSGVELQAITYPEWWGASTQATASAAYTINARAVNAALQFSSNAHAVSFEGFFKVNAVLRRNSGTRMYSPLAKNKGGIGFFEITSAVDIDLIQAQDEGSNPATNIYSITDNLRLEIDSSCNFTGATKITHLLLNGGKYTITKYCTFTNLYIGAVTEIFTAIRAKSNAGPPTQPMFNGTIDRNNVISGYQTDIHLEGVPPTNNTITGITQANPAVVTATAHNFSNGDGVIIQGVVGMTEVNNTQFVVANKTANTFELTDLDAVNIDSTGFTAYSSGGIAIKDINRAMVAWMITNNELIATAGSSPTSDFNGNANIRLSGDCNSVKISDNILNAHGLVANNGISAIRLEDSCVNIDIHDNYYEQGRNGAAKIHLVTVGVTDCTFRESMISLTEVQKESAVLTTSDFRFDFAEIDWVNLDRTTTPDIGILTHHLTDNVAPITITDFDNGYEGQELLIIGFDNGLTTFADSASLKINRDITLQDDEVIRFVLRSDIWYAIGGTFTPYERDTTTNFEDISSRRNTISKSQGKSVWNQTTGIPVWADGSAASATWSDATGAVDHTPV